MKINPGHKPEAAIFCIMILGMLAALFLETFLQAGETTRETMERHARWTLRDVSPATWCQDDQGRVTPPSYGDDC